jgi:3-dehydroquinate dehydratase II
VAYDHRMPPLDSRLDVLCLNGPNLATLGRRDPAVYGSTTLVQLEDQVKAWGDELNIEVHFLQSDHEGDLVEAIHRADHLGGIVINPGALTHTSAALHDAIEATPVPVVEVHISNVRARDRWRRRSLVAPVAVASIFGRGTMGYRSGLSILRHRQRWPLESIRYGPHPDQVLDIRSVPDEHGAAILIHGGFWLDAWGRDIVEGWAVDLADHGISTASIEYRRLGSGGGGLATVADVVEATAMAVTGLGAPPLTLVGHSAGAHLAVAAAARSTVSFRGLIGLAGVYDFEAPGASDLGGGAVAAFLASGGSSAQTAGLPSVPVVLFHGSDDEVVPASQSASFARTLTAAGGDVVHHQPEDVGHFDFLDPRSAAWSATRQEVQRLLSG